LPRLPHGARTWRRLTPEGGPPASLGLHPDRGLPLCLPAKTAARSRASRPG